MESIGSETIVGTESALRRALSHGPYEREQALESVLELLPSHPPMRVLARAIARAQLTDACDIVRMKAVEALGEIGSTQDISAVKWCCSDPSWVVRAASYSTLASLAGKRCRKHIEAGMIDRDPIVRRYAAVALFDAIGPLAAPIVSRRLLSERIEEARVGMLHVLALTGDNDALRQLFELVQHPRQRVSSPARKAMEDVKSKGIAREGLIDTSSHELSSGMEPG